MSTRYRILCYLIIVKKVFLVALVITRNSLAETAEIGEKIFTYSDS